MLHQSENSASYQIRAYEPGHLQINDQIFTHSIIVSAQTLIDHWPPQQFSELASVHFKVIIELKPAILLIGTGAKQQFPLIEVYGELINHGIGVEIMDTAAACRTFNALTSEDRNVVAALLIR